MHYEDNIDSETEVFFDADGRPSPTAMSLDKKRMNERRFMSENQQTLGYDDEDVKAPLLSKKEQN